jgi:hypothetical protein
MTALCGSWQKPAVDRPFAGTLERIAKEDASGSFRETSRQCWHDSEQPPHGLRRVGRTAALATPEPARQQFASIHERKEPMGDRTSLSIEVLAAARPSVEVAFRQEADEEWEGDLPGTVLLTFFEVDGGGLELLSNLAQSGVAFRGSHGDGLEYHGMTFAAADGDFAETPSPQGELMVGIDRETGEASARDLAAVQRWREIDRRVLALFARAGQ